MVLIWLTSPVVGLVALMLMERFESRMSAPPTVKAARTPRPARRVATRRGSPRLAPRRSFRAATRQ